MGCGSSSSSADSTTKVSRETNTGRKALPNSTKESLNSNESNYVKHTKTKHLSDEKKPALSIDPTADARYVEKESTTHQQTADKIKTIEDDIEHLKRDLEERITTVIAKEKEQETKNTINADESSNENTNDGLIEDSKEGFWTLQVEDNTMDDNSVVSLSQNKMDELDLFRGDSVLLKGKHGRETLCIALSDDGVAENIIALNRCVRKNLDVRIGDFVSIKRCCDVETGKKICVLPVDDTIQGFNGDLFEDFLKPYFLDAYRPIHKGDTFPVKGINQTIEFRVTEMEPAPCCVVAPDTEVYCEGEPVQRESSTDCIAENDFENLTADLNSRTTEIKAAIKELQETDANSKFTIENNPDVSMDDIGGLQSIKTDIMKHILLPLTEPEMFSSMGIGTSYILLTGPPGCGKTMLAKAIATDIGCCFISNKTKAGKSVPYTAYDLREIFDKARSCSPSILFLDVNELKARDDGSSANCIMINQLLSELDGLDSRDKNKSVFVIGSIKSLSEIDPALLRPGRLDLQIQVTLPEHEERVQILQATLRRTAEADKADLEHVASCTCDFTGADLAKLSEKAVRLATRSSEDKMNGSSLPRISRENWTTALETTQKSLSDEEVEHYKKMVECNTRHFRFAFPQSEEEKYGGYETGQFNKEDDGDVLYNSSKTTSHTMQNQFEDDDDDDLYT